MKKILVLIGLPGCGKDTVARILKDKGIPPHGLGDVVRRQLRLRGLPLSRENQELIGREMRNDHGMDVFARILFQEIDKDAHDIICINGPRSLEEIDHMSSHGDVVLIEIYADQGNRLKRMKGRGEFRDPKTIADLKYREESNLHQLGMKHVMETKKYPRYIVNNNGSKKDLRKQINQVLDKIESLGQGS